VPAELSSPIPAALAPLTHADPLRPAEPPQLLAYLATTHDPGRASGRRHPLVAILAIAAAAVLTGARSVAAIAEWAADAPQPVRPRSAPAVTPPTAGRCPPRPPPAGPWSAWTQRRWRR
jgi:DDE_Tnp_1-associated